MLWGNRLALGLGMRDVSPDVLGVVELYAKGKVRDVSQGG